MPPRLVMTRLPDPLRQSLLESLDCGVAIIDTELRVQVLNTLIQDLMQLPPGFFLKLPTPVAPIIRFMAERGDYGPGEVEQLTAERLRMLRNPEPMTLKRTRADGIVLEIRHRPLLNGRGLLLSYRDITQQHQQRRALEESETRLRDFARSSSDWLWEMDENLRFSWISEHYENKTGNPRSRLLGKTRQEVSILADDADLWAGHYATLESRQPFRDFEYPHTTPDGSRWMRVNGLPIFDEHGRFRGYRGTASDITALHEARMEASTAQNRLLQAIEGVGDIVVALFDANDRLVACNSRFGRTLRARGADVSIGIKFQAFMNLQVTHGLFPKHVDPQQWLERRMAYHRQPQGTLEMHRRNGSWFQVRETRLDDGGTLLVASDITELKQTEAALRQSEARFRDFAELAADVFWEIDASLRYAFFSEHSVAVLGMEPDLVLGRQRGELTNEDFSKNPEKWQQHLVDLQHHRPFQIEGTHRRPDNQQLIYLRTSGRPMFDADGEFQGYRGIIRDITEEHRMLERINFQASHDALTGLVNRQEFERRLDNALGSVKARGTLYTLCFLDLDQFKVVNDSVGHQAGDELLRQITGLLLHRIRQRDTLARLGGDEFGLLLENCPLDQGRVVAEALVAAVADYRFLWENRQFQVGASIGVVALSADAEGISEPMTRADVACYSAKEQGRNQVCVWQEDGKPARPHHEILRASELREALLTERFRLLAQPIVDLHTGQPRHWEILLRLENQDGRLILPGAFIPAAERYGVMGAIDGWVLRQTLTHCHKLPHGPESTVAVNLSASALQDHDLISLVRDQIHHHQRDPGRIIFEITEATAMTHLSRATWVMAELQALGCHLALDNFGSGLSSLSQLNHLPVDYLKVDGRLVRAVENDPIAQTMVATLAKVGQLLEITTVAEGVEDRQLTPRLQGLGIQLGQGFALGEPHPLPL